MQANISRAVHDMSESQKADAPPELFSWFYVEPVETGSQLVLSRIASGEVRLPYPKIMTVQECENGFPIMVSFDTGSTPANSHDILDARILIPNNGISVQGRCTITETGVRGVFQGDRCGVGADDLLGLVLVALRKLGVGLSLPTGIEAHSPSPNPSNRRRASKGKKPLYDWHTVTIEPPKAKVEPQGGHHASPRPHDVRGHFCTSVKGNRFWRKAHKKGGGEGFIFKDYVVKT